MEARATGSAGTGFAGAPARLIVDALDHTDDRRHLLERTGYSIERWFFDMERDLTEPVEAPRVPADLTLAAFDWAHDDAVRRAHNEAFATHWGSSQRSPEEWQRWFTGDRHFRPDLSFVVLDGDEVAAYALCHRYPEEDELHGYTSGGSASSAPGRRGGPRARHLAPPPHRRGDAGRRPRPRRPQRRQPERHRHAGPLRARGLPRIRRPPTHCNCSARAPSASDSQ